MSELEGKQEKYIDYPYDRFLKLRVEFLILTQSDLKARIMRLIEYCVETERQNLYRTESNKPSNKGQKIVTPDGIFAAISHKYFMEELWGVVQSETTLRDALVELENDHLVIRRPGGSGPYDPPFYTLNKPLITHLFTLLPPLSEIDMLSIMKQPRNKKNADGTIERGTIIDPLAKKIRDTIIAPPDPQLLNPYASIIVPLSRSGGVQLLDPIRYKEILKDKEKNITGRRGEKTSLLDLSIEELQAELVRRNALIEKPPTSKSNGPRRSVAGKSKQTDKTGAQALPTMAEPPQINEPDLSLLSERQRQIYTILLRTEDQPKYLAWDSDARFVYDNLLGKYGYTVPVNITPKVEECIKQLQGEHPTVETFRSIDTYAHKNDQFSSNGQKKPIEKQFYKGRGLKIWDYVREYAGWKSQQVISSQDEGATKKNQQLSREDLMAKALAFPVGMDHTTQQYEDLQNCMMYLQPDDRKEVTKRRLLKQAEQNKQRANAMMGA